MVFGIPFEISSVVPFYFIVFIFVLRRSASAEDLIVNFFGKLFHSVIWLIHFISEFQKKLFLKKYTKELRFPKPCRINFQKTKLKKDDNALVKLFQQRFPSIHKCLKHLSKKILKDFWKKKSRKNCLRNLKLLSERFYAANVKEI